MCKFNQTKHSCFTVDYRNACCLIKQKLCCVSFNLKSSKTTIWTLIYILWLHKNLVQICLMTKPISNGTFHSLRLWKHVWNSYTVIWLPKTRIVQAMVFFVTLYGGKRWNRIGRALTFLNFGVEKTPENTSDSQENTQTYYQTNLTQGTNNKAQIILLQTFYGKIEKALMLGKLEGYGRGQLAARWMDTVMSICLEDQVGRKSM